MSAPENIPLPRSPLRGFALRYTTEEQWEEIANEPRHEFRKRYFFFYGSLMDPATLTRVLGLSSPPRLIPAFIKPYHCKMWGLYPALFNGPRGSKVEGVAFEVQSREQVKLLSSTKRGFMKEKAVKSGYKMVLESGAQCSCGSRTSMCYVRDHSI